MKMLAISACVMMLSASFTGCAKSTPEATEEVDMSVSVETSKPDIRDISISSNFMQSTLDECLKIYPKTRLIPQVHKFIDVI